MIENLFPNVDWAKMWEATVETLYMTAISTLFTFVIGLALGVLLFLSGPGQLWANKIGQYGYRSIRQYFPIDSVYHINYFTYSVYKISTWNNPWTGCGVTCTYYRRCSVLCTNGINCIAGN